MNAPEWKEHPPIAELVGGLVEALGERMRAAVLYGPAARGEVTADTTELHLLLLFADLSPATLAAAGPALHRWVKRGLPVPRMFSPTTLAEAVDVFPIELGDIALRHAIVFGRDPFTAMPVIDGEHLRLQCERELREKTMRLEEGYALARGHDDEVRRLLSASLPAFAMVFRGCLRLHGDRAPEDSGQAIEAFCRAADVDPAPFLAVVRLRQDPDGAQPSDLFDRYHAALVRSIDAVDKFTPPANQRKGFAGMTDQGGRPPPKRSES